MTLQRRQGLRRDGPGARAFAAKRSTLRKGTGRAANGAPGISTAERASVAYRSGGRCEIRLPGCDQRAVQVHHRNRDRSLNVPDNLLHVCRSCHELVHREVAASLQAGWLVSRFADVLPPLPEPL